jgi:hypothetical protein
VSDFNELPQQPVVGFCQECGRALTEASIRRVGSAVFCEPCLERRLNAAPAAAPFTTPFTTPLAAGNQAAPPFDAPPFVDAPPFTAPPFDAPPFTDAPPYAGVPPAAGSLPPGWYGKLPSPTIAGLLGLIPGVGAMYNGQFAKGIAHIVIFLVLDTLEKMAGIFGLLVLGWECYMVFEAYHTAKARMEGMPLPDPFGLNNIGERFGIKANGAEPFWQHPFWQNPAAPTPPTAGYTATASSTSGAAPAEAEFVAAAAPWSAVPPAGAATTAPTGMWPPPAYAAPYSAGARSFDDRSFDATPPGMAPPSAASWAAPDYGAVYAAPAGAAPAGAATASAVPASSRFPAAAVWLIVLGVVCLLVTIGHNRIGITLTAPVVLLAVAAWLFLRNMHRGGGLLPSPADSSSYARRVLCSLRGAAVLAVIAILQILQDHTHLEWNRTWPILVIVVGVVLLLKRMLPPTPGMAASYAATPYAVAAYAPSTPTAAAPLNTPYAVPVSAAPVSAVPVSSAASAVVQAQPAVDEPADAENTSPEGRL